VKQNYVMFYPEVVTVTLGWREPSSLESWSCYTVLIPI